MFAVAGISAAEISHRSVQTSQDEHEEFEIQETESARTSDDSDVVAPAVVSRPVVSAGSSARVAVSKDKSEDEDDEGENEDEDSEDEEQDDDSRGGSVITPAAPSPAPAPAPKPTATTYTMAQVATHNSTASCYSVVSNTVYDLTPWIYQHPGGSSAIKSMCGVDATAAFSGQHGGQARPASELAGFEIGTLI